MYGTLYVFHSVSNVQVTCDSTSTIIHSIICTTYCTISDQSVRSEVISIYSVGGSKTERVDFIPDLKI